MRPKNEVHANVVTPPKPRITESYLACTVDTPRHFGLEAPRGRAKVAQLRTRQAAPQQPKAAVGRGDQPLRFDVAKRGLEPCANLLDGLNSAASDRDDAQDHLGIGKALQ